MPHGGTARRVPPVLHAPRVLHMQGGRRVSVPIPRKHALQPPTTTWIYLVWILNSRVCETSPGKPWQGAWDDTDGLMSAREANFQDINGISVPQKLCNS